MYAYEYIFQNNAKAKYDVTNYLDYLRGQNQKSEVLTFM